MQIRRFINSPMVVWVGLSLSFLVFSLCIGGDAVNGKIEEGRYYVRETGLVFREVSRVSFVTSALLVATVAFALPVCAFLALRREPFSGFVSRGLRAVLLTFFGLCGFLLLWAALARVWSAVHGT